MKTTGNTILITGGGTGMGLEAAKEFTKLGNKVIMVARNQARLDAEAAKLDGAFPFAADISKEEDVAQLIRYVQDNHPDLNMIFLNAAATYFVPLFDGRDIQLAVEEMNTNYLATLRLTQAFEPLLASKPEAAMVITGSGVAFGPDISVPTYSASKAAVHSLVQSIRLTLQRQDSTIKVFEMMAPLVDTPLAGPAPDAAKVPASEVIAALIEGLRTDELEMRVGYTEAIYEELLKKPDGALQFVNAYSA